MKKFIILLFVCLWTVACVTDIQEIESEGTSILVSDRQLPVTFSEVVTYRYLTCTMPDAWYAALEGGDGWCRISPETGRAGTTEILIQADANRTGNDRSAVVVIRSGGTLRKILVTQVSSEWVDIDCKSLEVSEKGGEIELVVNSNIRVRQSFADDAQRWIELIEETVPDEICSVVEQRFRYKISPNPLKKTRFVTLQFSGDNRQVSCSLTQGSDTRPESGLYRSIDYSMDGKYVVLQEASEGCGIDIVLMGDAFSDRLIADRSYDRWINKAVEALFAKEPFTSFRKLFNIYMVYAVSPHETYTRDGAKRALESYFGEGTKVGGNEEKCKAYTMNIQGMTQSRFENTMIIVVMNRRKYAGTCRMFYPSSANDYSCGTTIAWIPQGVNDEMFAGLVQHEAGGHGFAKLADEYSSEGLGAIPQDKVREINTQAGYGWLKNIDVVSEMSAVKWSGFLADSRYAGLVGVYEGGYEYNYGVYRPTKDGIMNTNQGEFNVPSRQAIYYRIHKLAYGSAWSYNYIWFLVYDAINLSKAQAVSIRSSIPYDFKPLSPPVITDHPL